MQAIQVFFELEHGPVIGLLVPSNARTQSRLTALVHFIYCVSPSPWSHLSADLAMEPHAATKAALDAQFIQV